MMDIRHPLTDFDRLMLDWSVASGMPLHILLTKADKLTRVEANKALSIAKLQAGASREVDLVSSDMPWITRMGPAGLALELNPDDYTAVYADFYDQFKPPFEPLMNEGKTIGVVTHGQGLWWLEITLTGRDAHTGSTPMNMRVNAGLGMARITERVHQIAMGHQPGAVGAVGQVKVFPNSRNVIPGKVIFTVDIRSPDQTKLDLMRGEVERAAHAVAAELGLGCAIEAVGHFDPVTFDAGLVTVVRGAAEKLGLSHMDIISGAGHDACWINRVAPTVMVMCPCVGGLSHNEAEEISPQWAAAGTDVLFHAVLETAIVVG